MYIEKRRWKNSDDDKKEKKSVCECLYECVRDGFQVIYLQDGESWAMEVLTLGHF